MSAIAGLPQSGFLRVDKPLRVTSFDIVAAVRSALHERKVGHAGTLDPLASGLLLVGYGKGTRLLTYLAGETKTYETVIRLGAATSTDDSEGDISAQTEDVRARLRGLAKHPERITQTVRERLTGDISQVPSAFSAVRVNGTHAYDLARAGKSVELAARTVTISRFDCDEPRIVGADEANAGFAVSANPRNHAAAEDFFIDVPARITCSAGTYIRSLGRDLGTILGVGGYLTALRRTSVGAFDIAGAATATVEGRRFIGRDGAEQTRNRAKLDESSFSGAALTLAQTARLALPCVDITAEQAQDLQHGRLAAVSGADVPKCPHDSPIAAIAGENLIAVCARKECNAHIARTGDAQTSDALDDNSVLLRPLAVFA